MSEKQEDIVAEEAPQVSNETSTESSDSLDNQYKREQMKDFAYKQVLKAHGIDFDVDSALDGRLTVEDGVVKGDVGYKPKSSRVVASGDAHVVSPPPNDITWDDVSAMSHSEINERYEEIKALMARSR